LKIRQGFVSNSSSSSFIVRACCLSPAQKAVLDNHIAAVELLGDDYSYGDCAEQWDITYDDHNEEYQCSTFIDNFRLREFFEDLHIRCGKECW
jgi:hypothetical protein